MCTKQETVATGPFVNYINKAHNADVVKAIEHSTKQFKRTLKNISHKKQNYAYAIGKWTIKEMLQHIIDTERVFAYRALRFARFDATPLPGFDENNWAAIANKTDRNWDELVKEFKLVRAATEILFASLNKEQLLFIGTASNHQLNTVAMGYVIAGHVMHHIDIINQRY